MKKKIVYFIMLSMLIIPMCFISRMARAGGSIDDVEVYLKSSSEERIFINDSMLFGPHSDIRETLDNFYRSYNRKKIKNGSVKGNRGNEASFSNIYVNENHIYGIGEVDGNVIIDAVDNIGLSEELILLEPPAIPALGNLFQYRLQFTEYTDCELRTIFIKYNLNSRAQVKPYTIRYLPSPNILYPIPGETGTLNSYDNTNVAWEYTGPTELKVDIRGSQTKQTYECRVQINNEEDFYLRSENLVDLFSYLFVRGENYTVSVKTKGPMCTAWSQNNTIDFRIPKADFSFSDYIKYPNNDGIVENVTLHLNPDIDQRFVSEIRIFGDIGNSVTINGYTGTEIVSLIDHNDDGLYEVSVQCTGTDGIPSNVAAWSVPVPENSDFSFAFLPVDAPVEAPFTYGTNQTLKLNPGIPSAEVAYVEVGGSIVGAVGDTMLKFNYSDILDNMLTIELKPDAAGTCSIKVKFEDKYNNYSNETVHSIRVIEMPSSISIIAIRSLYEIELGFTAANMPHQMKIYGDITDDFNNEYIDYRNTILINLTPYPGAKEIQVDFWNKDNNAHSLASTEILIDPVTIPILYTHGSAEDTMVVLTFADVGIPVSMMEFNGDITDPLPGARLLYQPRATVMMTPVSGDKKIGVTFYDVAGYEVGYGELHLTLSVSKSKIITQNNIVYLSRGIEAQYSYYIQDPGDVEVKIYEITGELIKTVYEGFYQGGILPINWDGRNTHGKKVAQGVYLLFFKAGSQEEIKKIVVRH